MLGEFVFDDFEFEKTLGQTEKRPMHTDEYGDRYEGEWLIGT